MKSGILDWWIRIRASYWFIPSLMALIAILASIGFVRLDSQVGSAWLGNYQWLYANQPAGARALLSTVAGSMITVAGVTFSMTLLAVSHASAQIGPRLVTAFMRDRANQFTLGTFIATFLYCILVLRTVHTGVEGGQETVSAFVPHLAILAAVALAILSVAVLIYFIHHVPQSISVSNVVARVGDELVQGIQTLYPERMGQGAGGSSYEMPPADNDPVESACIPVSGCGGYLRVLNSDGILALTKEHDLVVELLIRPGDFAVVGRPMLRARPAERVTEDIVAELAGMFSWGNERTREQDVMFPAEQLIEILGKAMSPGVNGQYTALLCINQIERAFAELLQRSVPDGHRMDEEERLRVIAQPVTHLEVVSGILRPVRQFVRDDWISTNYLLQMLSRLIAMPALVGAKQILDSEFDAIQQEAQDGSMSRAEKVLLRDAPSFG